MKRLPLVLLFALLSVQCAPAQTSAPAQPASAEQEIRELSRAKWEWMANKEADRLATLFHDEARFVHMSGTWGKEEEVDIIRTGRIHYKKADVHDVAVSIVDDVAIVWNRITLLAEVRGTEVTNPFTVTEVYKRHSEGWKLLALTFSSVRPEHQLRR